MADPVMEARHGIRPWVAMAGLGGDGRATPPSTPSRPAPVSRPAARTARARHQHGAPSRAAVRGAPARRSRGRPFRPLGSPRPGTGGRPGCPQHLQRLDGVVGHPLPTVLHRPAVWPPGWVHSPLSARPSGSRSDPGPGVRRAGHEAVLPDGSPLEMGGRGRVPGSDGHGGHPGLPRYLPPRLRSTLRPPGGHGLRIS